MNIDWKLVDKIFDQCIDIESGQRAGLIAKLAGDNRCVEEEVKKLLEYDALTARNWLLSKSSSEESQIHDHRIGLTIDGFEIEDKIGHGAFGSVYRASSSDGERVAIKFLKNWELSPKGIRRFRLEALVLARFSHPNVARLINYGQLEQTPYIVTELIDGPTLSEAVLGESASSAVPGPVELRQRLSWFRDIACGVAAVHEKMILHRDIKPSNIMIRSDGSAVVTDFGLAKSIDPQKTVHDLTYNGQIIGTPQFMPPEQLLGENDLGATADIYSLGAVLYFLLSGQPPFTEERFALLSEQIRFKQPPNPRSINEKVDRGLAAICLNCLKKDPLDRYRSVTEVVEDVERWLEGRPVHARSVSTRDHVLHWAKQNRSAAVLSITLLAMTAVALVLTTLLWQRSEANFRRAEYQKQDLLGTIEQLLEIQQEAEDQHQDMRIRLEMLTAITDSFDRLSLAEELDSRLLKSSAVAFLKTGRLESMYGDFEKSAATIEEAKRRFKILEQRHPENLEYQFDYFHCLLSQKKHEEALDCILAILDQDDSNLDYRATVSGVYFHLASDAFNQRDYETAREYYDAGEAWTKEILKECEPEKRDFHIKNIAEHWWGRSRTRAMLGEFDVAWTDLDRATSEFVRLSNERPDVSLFSYYAIDGLLRQAAWNLVDNETEHAKQHLELAEKLNKTYLSVHYSHPAPYNHHFNVLFHQAVCAFKSGDRRLLTKKQLELEDHLTAWELSEVGSSSCILSQARYWMDVNICRSPDFSRVRKLLKQVTPSKSKFCRIRLAFINGEIDEVVGKIGSGNSFNHSFLSFYDDAAGRICQGDQVDASLAELEFPARDDCLRSIAMGSSFYRFPFLVDSFPQELASCQDNVESYKITR